MKEIALKFIGREQQLADLKRFYNKKGSSFIVVTGRRRVGKSYLIRESCKDLKHYSFTGLPPSQSTDAQTQRNFFATQLAEQTGLPEVTLDDWHKLFTLLGRETQEKKVVVVLDEISWMGQGDDTFLPKLKVAWDNVFSQNAGLTLIVCGSVSTWIERNILSATGYFGRISQKILLEPFSLNESNQMLESMGFHRSSYEKFQVLSVTGNIPWYIEQIDKNYDTIDNIKQLGFRSGSIFVEEYDDIFHDLFGSRGKIYKSIVSELAKGQLSFNCLCKALDYSNSGTMTEYIDELIEAGFIQKAPNWNFKTGKKARLHQLRLSDNYLRFYLKCIQPHKDRIKKDFYANQPLEVIRGWKTIMGLQFENLVLNNYKELLTRIHITLERVIQCGSYFQRKTVRHKSCQIDFLIQCLHNTFFVCEIKFSVNAIGLEIIEEVKSKISALSVPSNSVCLPVLIHVGGVSDSVVESNYFAHIVDFNELLLNSH